MVIEPGVSDLDYPQWMELIEASRKWAFRIFGITILLPGEQADMFTKKELHLKWLEDDDDRLKKNP